MSQMHELGKRTEAACGCVKVTIDVDIHICIKIQINRVHPDGAKDNHQPIERDQQQKTRCWKIGKLKCFVDKFDHGSVYVVQTDFR